MDKAHTALDIFRFAVYFRQKSLLANYPVHKYLKINSLTNNCFLIKIILTSKICGSKFWSESTFFYPKIWNLTFMNSCKLGHRVA